MTERVYVYIYVLMLNTYLILVITNCELVMAAIKIAHA